MVFGQNDSQGFAQKFGFSQYRAVITVPRAKRSDATRKLRGVFKFGSLRVAPPCFARGTEAATFCAKLLRNEVEMICA